MTYPILDVVAAKTLVERLSAQMLSRKGHPPDESSRDLHLWKELVGSAEGAEVSSDMLVEESEKIRAELLDGGELAMYRDGAKKPDPDDVYLEEMMAEHLHRLLDPLPSVALHDARFWRYLGLFPFRWYLLEREPELQPQDYGGTDSGRDKWLMVRTYQWGRKCHLAGNSDPYRNVYRTRRLRREHGASEGWIVDFYHSHIVRPRWSDAAAVTDAFITATTIDPPLMDNATDRNEPVRTFARRISRLSGNVCLPLLDSGDLGSLVQGERPA